MDRDKKPFDIGRHLQELRIRKGFTQETVAKLINVEPATISGYERNVSHPSIDKLESLANVYGVSVDFLIGRKKIKCIELTNLTEEQQKIIENIVNQVSDEFRKLNKYFK